MDALVLPVIGILIIALLVWSWRASGADHKKDVNAKDPASPADTKHPRRKR